LLMEGKGKERHLPFMILCFSASEGPARESIGVKNIR
jgi:hypothetical protein